MTARLAPGLDGDPAGACPNHAAGTGRTLTYRQLAAALAQMLPEIPGEER
ncbi:MAG TPA: hypothetical protein VE733_20165 [Streptosporangiaceae bacterium]|nr:hypothetical protein [Streptosporangiaceae bacterium]